MPEEVRKIGTTRTFDTTQGVLTYAELSDVIYPHLVSLLDDVNSDSFAERAFDEELIKEFHSRIIGKVIPEIAGKWRSKAVQVGNHLPPEPFELPVLMREYTLNVQARIKNADTIEKELETLAYIEGEFLHIHPFQDFNRRTIRALLTEILSRFSLPIIDLAIGNTSEEFHIYQNALAEYDNGRMMALIDFWYKRFGEESV